MHLDEFYGNYQHDARARSKNLINQKFHYQSFGTMWEAKSVSTGSRIVTKSSVRCEFPWRWAHKARVNRVSQEYTDALPCMNNLHAFLCTTRMSLRVQVVALPLPQKWNASPGAAKTSQTFRLSPPDKPFSSWQCTFTARVCILYARAARRVASCPTPLQARRRTGAQERSFATLPNCIGRPRVCIEYMCDYMDTCRHM